MAGYTRQSSAQINTGLTISADAFNNEFNQIESAFSASSGHSHTGAVGEGPKISLINATTDTLSISRGGTGGTTINDAKTNLGLNNVDNTSDANKPVSTATQTALNTKVDTTTLNSYGVGASSVTLTDANSAPIGTKRYFTGTNTQCVAANLPDLGGIGNKWWNIDTYGVTNRTTQIATEVFGTGDGIRNRTFVRVRHDATWYPWVQIWNSGSDGAGSGLDADLLDGEHASYYQQNLENLGTIELGRGRSGDRGAALDFHTSGDPNTLDYSARYTRDSGVNGNLRIVQTGTGIINFEGGSDLRRTNNPILHTGIQTLNSAQQAQARANIGIDYWQGKAIGEPFPLFDYIAGCPIPPKGQFIKLTAGLTGAGQYNEGALSGESVTGSAPLVVATATISDADSPLNGAMVFLINTEGRFLRASTAPGVAEHDQMQTITGGIAGAVNRSIYAVSGSTGAFTATSSTIVGYDVAGPSQSGYQSFSFNSANSPTARAGSETRSKNVQATYYMRIK